MKVLLSLLLLMLSTFVLGIFLPWWSICLPCFLFFALVPTNTYKTAFIIGFVGVFILWSSSALYIDIKNGSILSTKIIQLFFLPSSMYWMLIPITGLVGGVVSGVSSMSGKYLNSFF